MPEILLGGFLVTRWENLEAKIQSSWWKRNKPKHLKQSLFKDTKYHLVLLAINVTFLKAKHFVAVINKYNISL